jgi:Xaa-Pro aminopeptidase
MTTALDNEAHRVARLLDAQAKAAELFDLVESQGIVAPGIREVDASNAIRDLAAQRLGVERHWHKRIVRSGPNTLQPYRQNPPDRVITDDDIVFLDFGPIFGSWEADFGRTFVIGNDPVKTRLCADLPELFDAGRRHFDTTADITGEQLFDHVFGLATDRGWTWGGTIAGHIVGEFPHDEMDGDDIYSTVMPGNTRPMRGPDTSGKVAHWILEIHIVDLDRQIGGFYEELLDIGHEVNA